MLGSKREVVVTIIAGSGGLVEMPAAFEGFSMATCMLRLVGDGPFLPAGLAKSLAPFALTIGEASRQGGAG